MPPADIPFGIMKASHAKAKMKQASVRMNKSLTMKYFFLSASITSYLITMFTIFPGTTMTFMMLCPSVYFAVCSIERT